MQSAILSYGVIIKQTYIAAKGIAQMKQVANFVSLTLMEKVHANPNYNRIT
jgi:hypothetical protein